MFLIDCYRYWINICQGIHDGPDPQICSERSASCLRTTDGKVHNLGTVTSQTLSMEGLFNSRNNTYQTVEITHIRHCLLIIGRFAVEINLI